jgi:hypothetical protein
MDFLIRCKIIHTIDVKVKVFMLPQTLDLVS